MDNEKIREERAEDTSACCQEPSSSQSREEMEACVAWGTNTQPLRRHGACEHVSLLPALCLQQTGFRPVQILNFQTYLSLLPNKV